MSWEDFFYGIQDGFDGALTAPMDTLRQFETFSSWWGANALNFFFMAICAVAIAYWLKQLAAYNATGEEDRSVVAHKFLGPDSKL